jgi:IMP dehydrogenase
VVNDAFELKGLITVKDITKQTTFPNAARDAGRLRVWPPPWAWALAPKSAWNCWSRPAWMRSWWTRHGHSKGVIDRVRWVKQNYPQVDVIGGNIATGAAALALVEAGADASRSVSAPAPSAPPVSWPVWACPRSWPSTTWPRP